MAVAVNVIHDRRQDGGITRGRMPQTRGPAAGKESPPRGSGQGANAPLQKRLRERVSQLSTVTIAAPAAAAINSDFKGWP